MSVLDSIVEATRRRIREGAYSSAGDPARPGGSKEPKGPEGARFLASLREPGARIIAEIKGRSPSAGEILPNCDRKIETLALAYRRGHAAAISVVTEREYFGGDPGWIRRAKRISGLPTLMKDFILEESQLDFAASQGADAVLLIVSILGEAELAKLREAASKRGMAALFEAHTGSEIDKAVAAGAEAVGVNARDLRDFGVSLEGPLALAGRIPEDRIRVAESGIRTRADVEKLAAAGYRAFLVGETLLRSEEPEQALRELRGEA